MRYLLKDWGLTASPTSPSDGTAVVSQQRVAAQNAYNAQQDDEVDISDLCRVHKTDIVRTWAEVMLDVQASPNARIAAASALADRGWGRSPSVVTAPNNNTINFNFSDQKPIEQRLEYAKGVLDALQEAEQQAKAIEITVEEEIEEGH